MRKLKGITINGEWLGDNVVINANFRAICNLAPFVMQEFAKLVNSIEKLESAVTINSFYFPDNNTVDIEFSNNNFSGLANLCFHLQNGLPELVNRSLTVYTEELKTTEEGDFKDSEEIFDKISENQEVETINEYHYASQEADEIDETDIDETIKNSEEILPKSELAEEPSETIKKEATSYEENEIDLNTKINTQDAISMMVEDLTAKAPALAPIQIQVVQAAQEPLENTQTKNIIQEVDKEFVEQDEFSAAVEEEASDNIVDIDEIKNEDVELQKSDRLDIEDSSKEYAKDETPSEIEFNFEPENNNENVLNEDENKIIEQNENTDISYNVDETQVEEDKNIIENKKETKEPEISEEQKEEIQDCLSDFYESTPSPTIEQIELKGTDNLAMQAMLNEMFILRDELNKLKNEKVTYEDIFGKKEKMKNNIEDEDADFRIMGSEERINASILDEELFVAGDKLYKWGDTLYLDE